jgi:hypothetical protein
MPRAKYIDDDWWSFVVLKDTVLVGLLQHNYRMQALLSYANFVIQCRFVVRRNFLSSLVVQLRRLVNDSAFAFEDGFVDGCLRFSF